MSESGTLSIVERLTRTTRVISKMGRGAFGIKTKEVLANPDGPEAAQCIEELVEALEMARYCAQQIAECPRYGGRSLAYMRATDILERITSALAKVRTA